MNSNDLYPLRFAPIFQYRLWGGRRLENYIAEPLPGTEPIGEAWVLSDRDDFTTVIADGPLQGKSITQLLRERSDQLIGKNVEQFTRFPLLLKFLDASEILSLQVHPSDDHKELLPPGEKGKTEAWVVLETTAKSIIYGGLKPGVNRESVEQAIHEKRLAELLPAFQPAVGDGIYLPAGTVHALGGMVVFEVQENSDMTFRLSDWDRVDAHTGKARELQVEQALKCIDWSQGAVSPVKPLIEKEQNPCRELLFACDYFTTHRLQSAQPFEVATPGEPRVFVCIDGAGRFMHNGASYPVNRGSVYFMPASLESCICDPDGGITLLETALPLKNSSKA